MTQSDTEPLLALDGATVRLGGRAVLHDLHLRIDHGEVVAVTGSNGAGKTTLLRLAANLVRPATGRRVGRPTVAYVPAAIEPPSLRAETWLHGVRKRRTVEPTALLEQLGFDGQLDRPCRELSFGNLRKLLLADAFSSAAELVVVDEAGEGLDSKGAATLVTLMHDARTQQRSVVFAEQQTQHLVGADRIVSLRAGRVEIDRARRRRCDRRLVPRARRAPRRADPGGGSARLPLHRGAGMIAFHMQLVVRSMRWLGAAIIVLIWMLISLSDPGPALANAGSGFLLLFAVTCWITVVTGNVDDDGHRELLAASAGSPGQLHRLRALSAWIAANAIGVVVTLTALVASSDPVRHTSEVAIVAGCVVVQLAATALGVSVRHDVAPSGGAPLGHHLVRVGRGARRARAVSTHAAPVPPTRRRSHRRSGGVRGRRVRTRNCRRVRRVAARGSPQLNDCDN